MAHMPPACRVGDLHPDSQHGCRCRQSRPHACCDRQGMASRRAPKIAGFRALGICTCAYLYIYIYTRIAGHEHG